ncbi:low molecular weight protein-tyrosine-phosphatase [Pseudoprimorskyibacter insulae]|uniref:protein-tyrosine-phosphatase n=1 Tax=Pseudoprimorskyibacter insulae TaxID=1695997 RepID=A0A2R8AVK3_9RHOB|nr:low molecular weight protein-tyrosine-phosphatase [Pseudoprimorskyibacter insulae]SPF79967.1 Low molecular weight protein-tyrosine-phosphatase YfkJ [Pseudoprimorskyibacter insulae]
MTHRILFVCLGNICRSPSAEGVVHYLAQARGMDVALDSAGTGAWHVGEPPYGPMQTAAQRRGYDLSGLRARQVKPKDFHDFDLILAMDSDNLTDLRAIQPKDCRAELRLFLDYAPDCGLTDVPDPYYTRRFDETLDLAEQAGRGLLDQLSR